MDSDLYEVHARAESASATEDEVRTMLQTLLADRFKLAVHPETRQLPSYTLSVDKGGSKLEESKDPTAKPTNSIERGQGTVRMSFQNMPHRWPGKHRCELAREPSARRDGAHGAL